MSKTVDELVTSQRPVPHMTLTYPQMRLLPEDVEGGLLLEELRLQATAACRGRQILPGQPGARLARRRMLAETAAGA